MKMIRHYPSIISLAALLLLSACSGGHFSFFMDEEQPSAQQNKAVKYGDAEARKADFFASMKPAVMQENKRLRELRQELLTLRQVHQPAPAQLERIRQVASLYKMKMSNKPDREFWPKLLARVDEVPLEMALVQAANESAWGQSRFAREGNNYYGQWCYKKGCGLVPEQRSEGATHEVRCFATMEASVRAYMQNINTSSAYAEFRSIRQSLRVQSRPLDAESLAYGLRSYSERGMAYVKTIRAMIRSNRELIANS